MERQGGEEKIREGVEYVGGRDLKYITHDGVEILTSKKREGQQGKERNIHKKRQRCGQEGTEEKSKNEIGRPGMRFI